MDYLTETLWLVSWPILIWCSYKFVEFSLKKMENQK